MLRGVIGGLILINNLSILYVEDEKHSRRILSLILMDYFKDVYLADNGREAVEIYKEKKIDIVLSDISMPIMDGIEMSIKIKEINPAQAIVLLTASQSYKYLEKAIEIGIFRYILKPINDLNEFINNLEQISRAIYEQKKIDDLFFEVKETVLIQDDFFSPTTLYKAYQNNEFEVYYQPQVDVVNKKYIGVDALIRWNSDNGLVYPNNFILGAIRVGLMVLIDEWVLHTSMKEFTSLYRVGLNPGVLSVNLMMRSLENKNFISNLKNNINEIGFKTSNLEFKIREHDIVLIGSDLINKIKEISDLGIRICIGNFGKGFMSYIKEIPINKIKIDKTYIDGIPDRNESNLIVKAIVQMGDKFNLDVVAEGVENTRQLDFLVGKGSPYIQGFLYSEALPFKKLKASLRAGKSTFNFRKEED